MGGSSNWYFSKKEIRQSPSVQQGLPLETEERYRKEGAVFIFKIGGSMNLSLVTTMSTGLLYFHRFYMHRTFQDFPRFPMACACLFLAGKVEETPKKFRDILKCAKDALPPHYFLQFGTDSRQWADELMVLEKILLQTLKFQMEFQHPYAFIMQYSDPLIGNAEKRKKMMEMAWTFVNDSWKTTLCLQWEPEIIAIAAMYLASKLSKFKIVDWRGRQPEHCRWWDLFVGDMAVPILEDICHQILDLYSVPKPSQPTDSVNAASQSQPNQDIYSPVSSGSSVNSPSSFENFGFSTSSQDASFLVPAVPPKKRKLENISKPHQNVLPLSSSSSSSHSQLGQDSRSASFLSVPPPPPNLPMPMLTPNIVSLTPGLLDEIRRRPPPPAPSWN